MAGVRRDKVVQTARYPPVQYGSQLQRVAGAGADEVRR
jgi:hypothetical protein